MPINLDDYRRIQECKGNKSNKIFIVEHRITRETSILKVITIKNLERQLREIETHCSVHGDHIIRLKDYQVTAHHILMLIEYAKHGDLFCFIPRLREMSIATVLRFYLQILQAVHHLHSHGFVHRDIKPENILIGSKFVPKLADFGASSKIGVIKNTYCGTYEYMAPEIVLRKQQSEKVDVWALGILLFEMLSGHTPFKDMKPEEIRKRIDTNEIVFPGNADKTIIDFILWVLKYEASERPSVGEMMQHPMFWKLSESQTPSMRHVTKSSIHAMEIERLNSLDQKVNEFLEKSSLNNQFAQSHHIQQTANYNPLYLSLEPVKPVSPNKQFPTAEHTQPAPYSGMVQDQQFQVRLSPEKREVAQNMCSIDPCQNENTHPPVVTRADLFSNISRTEIRTMPKLPAQSRVITHKPTISATNLAQSNAEFKAKLSDLADREALFKSHIGIRTLGYQSKPTKQQVGSSRVIPSSPLNFGKTLRKLDFEDTISIKMSPLNINTHLSGVQTKSPKMEVQAAKHQGWLDSFDRFSNRAKQMLAKWGDRKN